MIEKRNLIGKNVYFIFKNSNGSFTIGFNKLNSIIILEKNILYKINRYNNIKVHDVFENKEDLLKCLSDLLIII